MAAHWKFGDDFAIRYGPPNGIEWFFRDEQVKQTVSTLPGLSAAHPALIAIEAVKAVGILLQWWEMRKQTLLQTAQFEERRIVWLTDILAHWSAEVAQGAFRLDTALYLDREVSRLLEKIKENDLVDVPSSLLLQIDRAANVLVGLNTTTRTLLNASQNFILKDQPLPASFAYKPYYDLVEEPQTKEYIDSAMHAIQQGVRRTNPLLGVAALPLLWTVPKLFELTKWMKTKQRLAEFTPLHNFSIELRSSNALLSQVQGLPVMLHSYTVEDMKTGGSGRVTVLNAAD